MSNSLLEIESASTDEAVQFLRGKGIREFNGWPQVPTTPLIYAIDESLRTNRPRPDSLVRVPPNFCRIEEIKGAVEKEGKWKIGYTGKFTYWALVGESRDLVYLGGGEVIPAKADYVRIRQVTSSLCFTSDVTRLDSIFPYPSLLRKIYLT